MNIRKAACLAGLIATAAHAQGVPPVATAQGKIQGKSEGDTTAFLGIPYAAPPVGALRWQPPQPVTPWQGVRPATQPGAACMQTPPEKGPEAALRHQPMSEDCLTLNVWQPRHPTANPLPVMVWIHGGAFRIGAASLPLYNGAALAAQGAVIVSLNYRLGIFGTFAHPALGKDGGNNYGLLDQIAALKWVKQNIAAFGGDPNNVTVWGESAGGASVAYLMTSPLAAGLFNKAIMQSGAIDLPEASRPQAEAIFTQALAKAAAPTAQVLRVQPAPTAQALRALPAAQLLALPLPRSATMPFIDGRTLTQHTRDAFAEGHYHRVPLLIGSNDDEAGFFPPQWSASVPARLGEAAWQQARQLTDGYGSGQDALRAAQIATDKFATVNTRALANASAQHGQPTWRYYFRYLPASQRTTQPGAIHTAEIPYVFGTLNTEGTPDAASQALSRELMARWLAFARTGAPNPAGLGAWPPYQPPGQGIWQIGKAGSGAIAEPAPARLDFLEAQKQFRMN
ncbi:carboxylesterase [Chimaeribacter californicus]|uniref:Carboxylic ester hydrolase n=1 Tax=Chimaeribacter californicus TaxID=2060067 RepID=A0A2N5DWP1_9GAMM|nr:carboxylesterase family protein [Chimaeribacter californicus]PLR31657.1 carboxylesterase [Chimaeribacter californicus]